MVEFDLGAALLSGLVGTLVMTAMMTMSKAAGMSDMPPMPLVMGSMVDGDRRRALAMGTLAHYVVMGTVVFGLVYAALFTAFDNDAWWIGAVVGAVHGVLVGAIFMPMMPSMHPRMAAVGEVGSTVDTDERGEVVIRSPGFFGKDWGGMTPAGLVMGHAVYGLVAALVYGAVA